MKALTNLSIASLSGRPVLMDLYYNPEIKNQAIVLFAHGFKGFKDWGHWQLLAHTFANAGIAFLKFNFSYNGTTPASPLDFADLEAFGQNNYTRELQDLDSVLSWLFQEWPQSPDKSAIDLSRIGLIGHSRGGGISIVKADQDKRIKALITWASVSRLDYFWGSQELLKQQWKEAGVHFILNGRTKQQMPLYYQLAEDFDVQADQLDISKIMPRLDKPCMIIHGTKDPAVPATAAELLHSWNSNTELHLIQDANHVFGGQHPFTADSLPPHAEELAQESIAFLKKNGF